MNFTILRFDSIDSTNTEALRHARAGADEGICIVARRQTAGRGRQGRTWTSPHDAGLYMSIVLRPAIDAKELPLITMASAIAVYETFTGLGLSPDIKWPNDLLVKEKKIGGILAETTETGRGIAVIVGIGLNFTSESFSPEIAANATSIRAELGRHVTFTGLEPLLLDKFGEWYGRLCSKEGAAEILEQWSNRSSYARGKHVRVILSNGTFTGVTDGLEPNGALRVVDEDDVLNTIQAGDIERLRSAEQFN